MWQLITKYKKSVLIGLCVLCVAAFVTYSFVSPRGYFSGLKNDLKMIEPQEEFSYTDLEGNPVKLSDYRGKPIVINSWASWMPFSRDELKLLSDIAQQYEGRVHVIAINRMEQLPFIHAYIQEVGAVAAVKLWADPTDNFYKAVGGYAMPETIIYDADGVLKAHIRGVAQKDEIVALLQTLVD